MRASIRRRETHINMDVQTAPTQVQPAPISAVGMFVSKVLSKSTAKHGTDMATAKSPWIGLGYCGEVGNAWTCFAADSCGCTWPSPATSLAKLPYRSCADMGDDARVGLYAPSNLGGYALLPATSGQPISSIGPLLNYGSQPTRVIKVFSTSSTSTSSSTSSSSTRSSSGTVRSTSSSSSRSSTTRTSSNSVSPSPSASSPTSSSTSDPTPAADGGSTLSTGAKAGIGAGIGVIGLVATAVIAALLIVRKRRGLRDDSDPAGQHMPEKGTHSWMSTASERRY